MMEGLNIAILEIEIAYKTVEQTMLEHRLDPDNVRKTERIEIALKWLLRKKENAKKIIDNY